MKLTLEGHQSFHTEGSVTIELPAYMCMLPEHELEEARTATNRDKLILAAGRHPQSRDVVFLTGSGELMEIRWEDANLPSLGRVTPIDYGQTIRIDVNRHRALEMSNLWALDNAKQLIFLGALAEPGGAQVTYIEE